MKQISSAASSGAPTSATFSPSQSIVPVSSISETYMTMPQISSTVDHATLLAAFLDAFGIASESTTAIETATNPTSQSMPGMMRERDERGDAEQRDDLVAVERRRLVGHGDRAAADHRLPARRRLALEAVGGVGVGVDAPVHQVAPAEQEEHDHAQQRVEDQRGEEQQRRVAGQVVALDDAVDDRAEDADRREAAGGRAVDDHQAHQDRVDLELAPRSRARSAR